LSVIYERLSQTLRRRSSVTGLGVLLLLLYAGWIAYQWQRDRLYDFNLYYIAAAGLRDGVDVYDLARDYSGENAAAWAELAEAYGVEHYAPPYRYPPLTAQLVLPLAYLDDRIAGTLWLLLSGLAFAASAWLMGKVSHAPQGPALALGLMLVFVPALTTLHAGQVNGFVLLALTAGYWGLERRNDLAAGIGIAVAALLKLVPAALLLYLFWRKQWRAAFIALAAAALLMLTAPITFSPGTLSAYWRNFFVMGEPGTLFAMAPNQSLNGLWARLLGGYVADDEAIYRIYLLSALAVIAATLALCWPMRRLPAWWRHEFALIVCAINLITPYAWYHQLALLFIPLYIVTEQLLADRRLPALAAVLALLALTNLHGLLWHSFESSRWLTNFPLALNLTLAGILAQQIVAERRVFAAMPARAVEQRS